MVNGFHYCRNERSESKVFFGDGSLSFAGDDPDGAVIDLDR